jgi:hypothetical protein
VRRPGRALAIALIALAAGATGAAGQGRFFSTEGAKALDMAKAADEGAAAAQEQGGSFLKQLQALKAHDRDAEALKALLDEAGTAHEALAAYRRQTQLSADETYQLVTALARLSATNPSGGGPDPVRREVLEQRALLAAHEAAVMAARARAEAERLRALHAEARLLAAGRGAAGPGTPPAESAPAGSGREILVPNVVGARLDAASRDLQAVGLRLGTTTGPRDGYVVKQSPAAGARVSRQAAVNVTLSATAAGVTVITPR